MNGNNFAGFNNIYKELIDLIGYEHTIAIYYTYNGQQLSLPKRLYSKEYIEQKVREEYNGHNTKELAQKYSYTERWVTSKINKH